MPNLRINMIICGKKLYILIWLYFGQNPWNKGTKIFKCESENAALAFMAQMTLSFFFFFFHVRHMLLHTMSEHLITVGININDIIQCTHEKRKPIYGVCKLPIFFTFISCLLPLGNLYLHCIHKIIFLNTVFLSYFHLISNICLFISLSLSIWSELDYQNINKHIAVYESKFWKDVKNLEICEN